ncbi:MAG: CheR family methyltransferase, partial [Fibrobacterota bacterium]
MTTRQFRRIVSLVYEEAGIFLKPEKRGLVESRLSKRMRRLSLSDIDTYLAYFDRNRRAEMVELVNVISTNYTRFFREADHFDVFRRALTTWYGDGQHRFRIWCAAASTGQEPYTIAMTARDLFRD